MTNNNISFPYPVLGNADDISGDFSWEAAYKMSADTVTITARLDLENSDLLELIKNEKAAFALRVDCPITFYRETFIAPSGSMEIPIAAGALKDSVNLTPYIIAIASVKKYSPRSAHKDYRGTSFNISNGGILVIGPRTSFIADKEFVGSKRRIQSIMEVVKHTREGADPEFKLGGNKIEIYLNAKDWDVYQAGKARPEARNIIHASVVFPVLLEALDHLEDDEYIGCAWRDRLKVLLQEKALIDSERFQQAMGLLKNPISRGFSGLGGLLAPNTGDSNEDEN